MLSDGRLQELADSAKRSAESYAKLQWPKTAVNDGQIEEALRELWVRRKVCRELPGVQPRIMERQVAERMGEVAPFRHWTNDTGPKTCADCSHEQTCERSRRRQCGEAKLEWTALNFNQMRARKRGPWAEPTETPEAGASAEDEGR